MKEQLSREDAIKKLKGSFDSDDFLVAKESLILPTGFYSLDYNILGIGGLKAGYLYQLFGAEQSGKTLLCYRLIAQAQKLFPDKVPVFLDTEFTFDWEWATRNGVDVDRLLVKQTNEMETAFADTLKFVDSGLCSLVILDSLGNTQPKSKLDHVEHYKKENEQPGLHAKKVTTFVTQLCEPLSRTQTFGVFTNQMRDKIGVLYGCSHYKSQLTLEGGGKEYIGKYANGDSEQQVYSFNFATQSVELKPVISKLKNGTTNDFVHIQTTGGPAGKQGLFLTGNHIVYNSEQQEIAVSDLRVGDQLLSLEKGIRLTPTQEQIIYGSALGDGSCRLRRGKCSLRYLQGIKQKDYLLWKFKHLENISNVVCEKPTKISFETKSYFELNTIWDSLYTGADKKRKVTSEYLEKLTPLSIACWYMDDGTFSGTYEKWGHGKSQICNKTFCDADKELVVKFFFEKFGIVCSHGRNGFLFSGENCRKFQELIAEFVIPSLQYKIHPRLRSLYKELPADLGSETDVVTPVTITKLEPKKYVGTNKTKYDLEVAGNSNYFLGGILVHNSTIDFPGGRALKHNIACNMYLRNVGYITEPDSEDPVGVKIAVDVKKNKTFASRKTDDSTHLNYYFDDGIAKAEFGSLIDEGVRSDFIVRSGPIYKLIIDEVEIAKWKGKAAMWEAFKSNEDGITDKLKEKVYASFGQNTETNSEPEEE